MSARYLATTALILVMAAPAAAGAGQSITADNSTKVEQSTSASVSTSASELMSSAKTQLHSAMTALEGVKDGAAEEYAEARKQAGIAVDKIEAALDSAKDSVAETSSKAVAATRAKIAEARKLIEDRQSKPDEIASSLDAVGTAAGDVRFDGTQKADAGMQAGAKADADSDTGIVAKVGSALGLGGSGKTGAGIVDLNKVGLVGKTVYGADQQAVGKIDDVVMAKTGGVESVLVDVGGFLGIGSKSIAIPVSRLEVHGDTLVAAGLTKQKAEMMPEYKTGG